MTLKSKTSILIVLLTISVSCQKTLHKNLVIIDNLPSMLKEISGITLAPPDSFIYAINDSGNSNTLFKLDQKGKIIKEIQVPDAKNIDWEDLTYDKQGNLYIGDFGNNDNDRTDLAIYKISGIQSNNISTTKIEFRLEDQKKFPPKKKNRNFDIEAFVYHKGGFYLFTKNRSSKFNGETKLYKLLDTPENQFAKLIASYTICNDPADCFVTGAAINNKGDKIVLLTYNKIVFLTDFKEGTLFNGKVDKIKLKHFSQKEGVCFKNDSTLYIVDEKRKTEGAYLYEYNIK